MFVFICPGCGGFGLIPTPKKAIDAACPYCTNKDIDWVSRPDLDEPKSVVGEQEGDFALGTLRSIETLALRIVKIAHQIHSSDNQRKKGEELGECERRLYSLFDRFSHYR